MTAALSTSDLVVVPATFPVAQTLVRLPTDAVASGVTAARIHGLWLPHLPDAPVDVTVPGRAALPRDRAHSVRTDIRFRRRTLRSDEVTVVDGLPVTTIGRTWLDLAEVLGVADLVAAGDCALRCDVGVEQLGALLDRAVHRRGVVRARTALPLLDARSRSRPESCLRYELVASGLPTPEVNMPVVVNGVWIGEPDLLYRKARIGIEYQGGGHANVDRMRRDITRKLDFSDVDWLIIEAGPDEVFRFQERITARVRFELARRM